jgi:dTDP-4-dehydrorhamnose reductase
VRVAVTGANGLRGGARVDRAAALLREKPLPVDQAIERFHAEWRRRTP